MDFFTSLFEYKFLSNALIACVLSGVVCGIIGTYVVCRRTVFLSGGITHASFGGIGMAYYLGLDPVMGAAVFAVLSALGVEISSSSGKVREDSAIGIIWSLGMAAGIIFIYLTPGYAPNLMSYLFGSILTVTDLDILRLGLLALIILAVFVFAMRRIVYVAFDREYARSQGVPVKTISCLMSVLVALAIVFSIRTVGIVLLISLLTMPAVIGGMLSKTYKGITVIACAAAVAGNFVGLWMSYMLNIPAGASAVIVLGLIMVGVRFWRWAAAPSKKCVNA